MEQLEFDCRLESERELEENVNIALEFACKQVKETSKSKVSNRHDGYGIASEFYAGMKLDQKKVDESMKDFLRILPTEDDAKAVEAAQQPKECSNRPGAPGDKTRSAGRQNHARLIRRSQQLHHTGGRLSGGTVRGRGSGSGS